MAALSQVVFLSNNPIKWIILNPISIKIENLNLRTVGNYIV